MPDALTEARLVRAVLTYQPELRLPLCEYGRVRVVRGLLIFIAATVAMLALLAVLGNGAGSPELTVILVVSIVAAVKLSAPHRARSAKDAAQ